MIRALRSIMKVTISISATLKTFVNLKLQGSAQVKGSTEGTSDWATLAMEVKAKDFWLEDFGVGI